MSSARSDIRPFPLGDERAIHNLREIVGNGPAGLQQELYPFRVPIGCRDNAAVTVGDRRPVCDQERPVPKHPE